MEETRTQALVSLLPTPISFPANATDVRVVGGDLVCRFIYDDGLSPNALAASVVATHASARFFLTRTKEIEAHPAIREALASAAPRAWDGKPLSSAGLPTHCTLLHVNGITELGVVYLAFAGPHPAAFGPPQPSPQLNQPMVTVDAALTVSLNVENFATWVRSLQQVVGPS